MLTKCYGYFDGHIQYEGKEYTRLRVPIGKNSHCESDEVLVAPYSLKEAFDKNNEEWEEYESCEEYLIDDDIFYYLDEEDFKVLLDKNPDLYKLKEVVQELYDDDNAELKESWEEELKKRRAFEEDIDNQLLEDDVNETPN